MVAASTEIDADIMVQRAHRSERRPSKDADDRGARAQAARISVEVCELWRRDRRCDHENRLKSEMPVIQKFESSGPDQS